MRLYTCTNVHAVCTQLFLALRLGKFCVTTRTLSVIPTLVAHRQITWRQLLCRKRPVSPFTPSRKPTGQMVPAQVVCTDFLPLYTWSAFVCAPPLPSAQYTASASRMTVARKSGGASLIPCASAGNSRGAPSLPPLPLTQKNKPVPPVTPQMASVVMGPPRCPLPLRQLTTPQSVGIFGKKVVGIWETLRRLGDGSVKSGRAA